MESLAAKIAQFVQLPAENVVIGNGSNSLIQALLMVTLAPQDRLIIPEPTFTLYGLTGKMLGAEVVTCRLNPDDFSFANFFLVRVQNSAALFQHLLQDGILVRDVSGYPGLENCLRISVGTLEENQRLLDSLRKQDQ